MAQLAGVHADAQQLSKAYIGGACKGSLAAYASPPFLDNTSIAAANTNLGLRTAVTTAAASMHADQRFMAPRINLGILLGLYSTELSDARVLNITTGAQLVGLTYSDPLVVAGAAFPPE
jgi:hypothetical protein